MTTPRRAPRRTIRTWALAAAILVALAAMAVLAPRAGAGTYVAVQCHSGHDLAAADARFSRTSDHYAPARACAATDAGLQIRNGAETTKAGRYGEWSWRAPAGTSFAQITSQGHVGHDAGHKGHFVITDAQGRAHHRWPAEGSWRAVEWGAGHAATAFAARLRCQPSASACGRSGSAHAHLRRVWFTIRDSSPPALTLSGPLFAPGPRRGTQQATVSASDSGGGIRRWSLFVNGAAAGVTYLTCDLTPEGAARRLVPCPLRATRTFGLDTERAPFRNGLNRVTACVADAGSSANQTCRTHSVRVDNTCPSSGAGPATGLSASFPGGAEAITIDSNRRATIGGRVRIRGGGGAAGARICVYALVPGRPEALEAVVPADDGGELSHVPRRGPSRRLRLAHRHGSVQVETTLRLRVRVRPRLKVGPRKRLRNGQVARFRGKLPGPGAEGRIAILQARVGGRWQAFKSARSGPEGTFAARYRFRETTERRLYRFRAIVREQAGYPYLPGASPVRRVVVSP
jgi:hypothetical protein